MKTDKLGKRSFKGENEYIKARNLKMVFKHLELNDNTGDMVKKNKSIIGRQRELAIVMDAIKDDVDVINIHGIRGIGKTNLCREIYWQLMEVKSAEDDLLELLLSGKIDEEVEESGSLELFENDEDDTDKRINDEIDKKFGKRDTAIPIYIYYNRSMDDSILQIFNIKSYDNIVDTTQEAWVYLEYLAKRKKIIIFVEGVNLTQKEDYSLNKLLDINCKKIIVSDRKVYNSTSVGTDITLDYLNEIEGYDLFCDTYDENVYDEDIDNIKYIVNNIANGHPFTITSIANIVREKNVALDEIISILEKKDFRITRFDENENISKMQQLVKEYKKLYDILELEYEHKNIIETFTVLPLESYYIDFCKDFFENDANCKDINDSIDYLVNLGLLEYDEQMRVSINSLWQYILRNTLTVNASEHKNLIKTCKRKLYQKNEERNELDIRNKYCITRIGESIVDSMNDDTDSSIASLASRCGKSFIEFKGYKRACDMYRQSIVIDENTYGKEHLSTSFSYIELGNILFYEKDYELALSYYHKALEIQETQAMKDQYPYECYKLIARTNHMLKKYDNAIEDYTRCLEILGETNGFENIEAAIVYSEMADVYIDTGKYDRGLKYYRIASDIREKIGSFDYIKEGASYANVANVYRKLGEFTNSVNYYKKAIEAYNKDENSDTKNVQLGISKCYNGLAATYALNKNFDSALNCCSKSVEISEAAEGKNSASVATAYNNMALVYSQADDFSHARRYFMLALEILQELVGEENAMTSSIYRELGDLYKKHNHFKEAKMYYQISESVVR